MTDLRLYEELLLLSLHDGKGKIAGTYVDLALAAGVLGELMRDGRVAIADDKKATLTLVDDRPTEEPVIDAVVDKMSSARRDVALGTWIQRISGMRGLKRLVADRLVEQGILAEQKRTALGVVSTTRYPVANPETEREVIRRLRQAVLDDGEVDERTCLLIAVADSTDLLPRVFARRELTARKKRIDELSSDERLGEATYRAVQAIQAAIVAAIVASTASN